MITDSPKTIVNPLLWGTITHEDVEKVGNMPMYQIGEIVNISTWVGMKYGFKIEDITVTYHDRFEKYVWGYKLYKEKELTSFAFEYIPEGYLRKVNEND